MLEVPAPVSSESPVPRIPKRVFQTAQSSANVDVDLSRRLEMSSPGFERVFFDDAAAQEYMAREYAGTQILDAYEVAPRAVMRADIFRLAVVAREGGFYFDVDVYVKRSLEPLFALTAVLPLDWWLSDDEFMERHQRNISDAPEHWHLGNYAFGARPNHPLLVDALDEAANRTMAAVDAPGDSDVLRATGPYMLSEVYHAGRRAGKYSDVELLRGDTEPRVGRPTSGGADWHKFGSFAEHLLAHTWVTKGRRRIQSDSNSKSYSYNEDEGADDSTSYSYNEDAGAASSDKSYSYGDSSSDQSYSSGGSYSYSLNAGEQFCEESGFSEEQCESYASSECRCAWNDSRCWWGSGSCGGDDESPYSYSYENSSEDGYSSSDRGYSSVGRYSYSLNAGEQF
jgi:hypothetical protein